jgi:hypothetical protein
VLRGIVPVLLAAALLPAVAAAATPSVPGCALGVSAGGERGLYGPALARAEQRFAARHRSAGRPARRAFSAGVAAWIYGLPPLTVRETVERFSANRIVSIAALVRPRVRTIVAPNVDTSYSLGRLDLSGGPVVVDVPDTAGRYYVLQLLDLYSNTIGYIGRRTTGTRAGSFVVVPPGYDGPLPAGVRRVRSPTDTVWLLGRTLVQDETDLAGVVPLLRGYTVTPLGSWDAGRREPSLLLPGFPDRLPPVRIPSRLAFFDELGALLADQPPPPSDACLLRAFRAAGIGPDRTPSREVERGVRAALAAAPGAGARLLAHALRRANASSRRRNNGWLMPRPYVGDYGRNYLGRALVARIALGANTPAETVYPYGFSDSRRRPLRGLYRYTLRFPRGQLPPVGAFWSLTMYNSASYLYANPIDRYAIGDRTRGLRRSPDGSLTLHLQHRAPADAAAHANWLPSPKGRFRVIMRLYEPRRSVLRGSWRPPPIRRR